MIPALLSAITRLRRDKAGAAAVEFALVGSLVISLLIGSVEIMRLMNSWSTLQWATNQVARQAMVTSMSVTEAQTSFATAMTTAGFNSASGYALNVTSGYNCASGSPVTCVQMNSSIPFRFYLSTFGVATMTLRSRTVVPLPP